MKFLLFSPSLFPQGLLATLFLAPGAVLAALGASVTLVGPDPIFPGETTSLRIQLSNSANTAIAGVAFPVLAPLALPGTLPDGLRVAGLATFEPGRRSSESADAH
jgi:hypothetical protein